MGILKTAKKKAIDEARRTAKDVSGEILEIPKSVPKQAVGEKAGAKKKETTSGLPKLPSLAGFDVGEDVKKLPKDVTGQVVGKKTGLTPVQSEVDKPLSPIVEAMQQSSKSKDESAAKPVKKLSLEEEMSRLRALRDKQEKEWEEQQRAIISGPQLPTKPGAPIAPPSSSKKGPKGPGGPKKAQIETRKSKH